MAYANQKHRLHCPLCDGNILHLDDLGRVKRIWYLLPMRAAKVQASLRIRAVSPEPLLLAHASSESRGTFRQKARSLASLNGWACAVKFVMTECSKTQIRLMRSISSGARFMKQNIMVVMKCHGFFKTFFQNVIESTELFAI